MEVILNSSGKHFIVFKVLRILRLLRIIRFLKFMRALKTLLKEKAASLLYVGLLLLLIIVMYTLIGNQLYATQLNNVKTGIRQSFDTLYFSFLCVFQLVTIENWNDIETITLNSSIRAGWTSLYLITLIFLSNYVFLHLLLAILLDGFYSPENKDEIENEQQRKNSKSDIENRSLKNLKGKSISFDSDGWEEMRRQSTVSVSSIKQKEVLQNQYYCEDSLSIFKRSNIFRKICNKVVLSKVFKLCISLAILFGNLRLQLDNYHYFKINYPNLLLAFDLAFLIFIGLETILKIVTFGFVCDKETYLRNYWNIVDLLILLLSVLFAFTGTVGLQVKHFFLIKQKIISISILDCSCVFD